MKRIFLITILLASSVLVYSQNDNGAEDETGYDLGEVVVLGENAWIEDGKYNFIPTKSAKNLSRNMEDLIERMHTGILMVENGKIKSVNGQSVSVFINGVLVDDMDKATFWAKNALRVEYMESSDDPRFMGATNIVNFIMRDYVAGGLTKLDGYQQLPNEGNYSAASKLVWGKMTYNALFKGGYSRDHQSGNETTEQYDGIHYDGIYHDRVQRIENGKDVRRSNDLYGGFNARYKTDKFMMTHSVALQWNEDPGSLSEGSLSYSPEIISSDRMISRAKSRSLSPSLEGVYQYNPSSKWTFAFNWSLSHSHNNNNSFYEDLGLSPVITDSRENNYGLIGHLFASCMARNNLFFQTTFTERRNVSDADYGGNTNSTQWQSNGSSRLAFRGWWRMSHNLVLDVKPELTLYDYNINHNVRRTEWTPGVNASLWFGINDRNSLSLSSTFIQENPASSQRNDLILRSTELKWIEGNPYIGSSSRTWVNLLYAVYPCSWFNTTVVLDYNSNSNVSYLSYRAGGEDYDGVVGKYQYAPSEKSYGAHWNFSVRLFDGKLKFSNMLQYRYQRVNGRGVGNLYTRPRIISDFGNCSLTVGYNSPEKSLSQGGTEILRTPSDYYLTFGYGNGNLILNIGLHSPFNKYSTRRVIMDNGPYHYTSRNWSNGRNVSVSLTYTFDYGKKVDPGVDISEQDLRSTSVLGSDR